MLRPPHTSQVQKGTQCYSPNTAFSPVFSILVMEDTEFLKPEILRSSLNLPYSSCGNFRMSNLLYIHYIPKLFKFRSSPSTSQTIYKDLSLCHPSLLSSSPLTRKYHLTFTEYILCARHCFKYFIYFRKPITSKLDTKNITGKKEQKT